MNIINWITQEWTDHGTKILGSLTAIVAGLLLIPEMTQFSATLLGLKVANVILGVWTVNRGFVNSAVLKSAAGKN